MQKPDISQIKLIELMNYDPDTGLFTWLSDRQPNVKKGAVAGTVNHRGYVVIMIHRKTYSAHRLAWLYMTGSWPKNDIDHRNQMRTDNRFSNIREATRKENSQNVNYPHHDNKSGYQGVHWNKKCKKFQAQISVSGKKKHIGLFDSAEVAHAAYREAKQIIHPFSVSRV